jgi:hypothetical protein
MSRPRTVLLCHHDTPLHFDGIARWLASWSDLRGIVIIEEPSSALRKRLRREASRVGWLRMLDVLAFRLFHRLTIAARDRDWINAQLMRLQHEYPAVPASVPVLRVTSANSRDAQDFITAAQPQIILALVKNMLAERIFGIATTGTFVLHPGICPEYRNSHGCFWALANDDLDTVGMTLLRIDKGVDTGPVFGYFRTTFDEVADSHIQIQNAMVLDNLPAIGTKLTDIAAGTAPTISIDGRTSRVWGQPWLTAYLRWKRHARRRQADHRRA